MGRQRSKVGSSAHRGKAGTVHPAVKDGVSRSEASTGIQLDPEEHEAALDALAKLLTRRVVERYRERVRRRARGS